MDMICKNDVIVNGMVVYTAGERYEFRELDDHYEINGNFGVGVFKKNEPDFINNFEVVEYNKDELLTTGEMIDKLKIGDKAISNDGKYFAKKTEHGMLVITNEHGNVGLNEKVLNVSWKIAVNYVTFDEAMKSLKEGKDVTLHLENGKTQTFSPVECIAESIEDDENEWLTWEELFEGKWTVNE